MPASDEISGQKIKETTGSPDSSKFISEYAKSSRSACKKCSQTIAAKELRLGLVTRNFRGFDMTQWHHVGCFPVDSDPISSVEDIGGFSELQVSLYLKIQGIELLNYCIYRLVTRLIRNR